MAQLNLDQSTIIIDAETDLPHVIVVNAD